MPVAQWKIHSETGTYEGEAVFGELAAAMVAVLGDGSTVRTAGGQVVWREGAEEFSAGESYDNAAETFRERALSGAPAPDMPGPLPREGIDRCDCGSKYWDGDVCHSCGEKWRR